MRGSRQIHSSTTSGARFETEMDKHGTPKSGRRHRLKAMSEYFDRTSRDVMLFTSAVGVVILIGLVDHSTGQLSLALFYVLPIVAVAWSLATACSAVAAPPRAAFTTAPTPRPPGDASRTRAGHSGS